MNICVILYVDVSFPVDYTSVWNPVIKTTALRASWLVS